MATDRTTKNRQDILVTEPVAITFADAGVAIDFAELPVGAQLLHIFINVTVVFNSSGTDLLDVGDGADTDRFQANLDVSALGLTTVGCGGFPYTAADNIQAQFDQSVADATTGALTIQAAYVIADRTCEQYEA